MTKSIGRIDLDRLSEAVLCLDEGVRRELLAEVAPLQVHLVRRRIVVCLPHAGQGAGEIVAQPRGKRADDGACHLILDGEDVLHLAVVALGPQVEPVAGLEQLDGDADMVAIPPYAALENVARIERLADAAEVFALALEGKRRGPPNDLELWDLCQRAEDLLGDSV